MSERLTSSTEGPMLVAPREVLVCCVLPWSFPARVSCPMLRFIRLDLTRLPFPLSHSQGEVAAERELGDSFTLAAITTGVVGRVSLPTPLGSLLVLSSYHVSQRQQQ